MATLKNKSLKKSLSEKAEENASVTKGTFKNQEVLKEGKPNDHAPKHLNSNATVVGMSIGSTLNMGDYESLRVDVWLSDEVQNGETIEQAYERVARIVDDTLQKVVNQYK